MKSVYYLILLTMFLASCSAGSSEEDIAQMIVAETQKAMPILPEMLTPYASPKPTDTSAPTATRASTATPVKNATQIPTLTASPFYSEPLVLLEFRGTGETITKKYLLPKCWKAVYYWQVSPSTDGSAAIILDLHQATTNSIVTLVNLYVQDGPIEGLNGSVL